MEYRKSDAYLMKLKYMKLKKYLKEIDERQKGALRRNQAFLQEFDHFEAHMKTSSSEMIRKMEVWYGREIKSVLSLQEANLSAEGDEEEECNEQMPRVGRQAGISTGPAVPRGLYHPATVFMGRPTSAVSAAGGLGLNVWRGLACSSSPKLDLPRCKRWQLMRRLAAPCLERPALLPRGTRQPLLLLPSPCSAVAAQNFFSLSGPKPLLSNRWTCKEASWESSAELPVPASTKEVMLQGTASPGSGWERGGGAHTAEGSPLQPPSPPTAQEEPSVSSAPDGHRGMLAGLGLPRALQLIEDVVTRTSPQHRALYQGEHVGTMGMAELLSFCNRAGSLKDDDLEACEAVVLHQLRALLQSVLNGCLLPEKTLNANGRAADENQSRPDQQWDVEVLQTRLSNHALFLKKHQVQLTEEVAEMFESLLVSSKKAQDGQALPVLREVLPEECGDRSSIQSNESSYSSPSIPNGGGEIKQAKHAPRLTSAGEQEVTSWCEDESKEESAVEKIPITGRDSGNNSSKAKASQDTHSETSCSSNERTPPFSR
nr:PREDICTED: centrosomal protein kizuna [Phalacrocorax carbo]